MGPALASRSPPWSDEYVASSSVPSSTLVHEAEPEWSWTGEKFPRSQATRNMLNDGVSARSTRLNWSESHAPYLRRSSRSGNDAAVEPALAELRSAMSEDHEEHIQRQYLELLLLFQSKDFQEGLHSYLEKRPARFEGQ